MNTKGNKTDRLDELDAVFYGVINKMAVLNHYDSFIQDLKGHLLNPDFQERLKSLKPRGQISGGKTLPESDNVLRHVNRLRYRIRRCSSKGIEWYWIRFEVHYKSNDDMHMNLGQIYLNSALGGSIAELIERIGNEERMTRIKNILAEGVYDDCYGKFMKVTAAE